MIMRAFDMESGSTSASPDGTAAPLSGEDAASALPTGPAVGPAKATTGEAAPTKPPPASLVSIPVKSKPAGTIKAGDLTRLFELSRRQTVTPAAPIEPSLSEPSTPAGATTLIAPTAFLDASEALPQEIATEPPVEVASPIEPALTGTETPNEETSAEIEALKRPLDIAPAKAEVETNALAAEASVPASSPAVAHAEQPKPATAAPKLGTERQTRRSRRRLKR